MANRILAAVASHSVPFFGQLCVLGLVTVMIISTVAAEFRVPPLTGPVVDQASVLNENTEAQLGAYLQRMHARGGAQIQVATVLDLFGLSIEEVSIRITDAWQLGSKQSDRGVLLLVAPQDRRVRIEVGQGLRRQFARRHGSSNHRRHHRAAHPRGLDGSGSLRRR